MKITALFLCTTISTQGQRSHV